MSVLPGMLVQPLKDRLMSINNFNDLRHFGMGNPFQEDSTLTTMLISLGGRN
jgi:hypothetical protein